MKKGLTYGIYIYEQVAELDFVAPMQVFAASNQFAGGGRVVTLSCTGQMLCGLSGLRITPDYSLQNAKAARKTMPVLCVFKAQRLSHKRADSTCKCNTLKVE